MPTSSQRSTLLTWSATAVVVLVGALSLYLIRVPLAEALDPITPSFTPPAPPPPPPVQAPPPPPPPPPPEPQMSLLEVEEALAPLGPEILGLAEVALEDELPLYREMDSQDEFAARRMRERFAKWGPIWRNRLNQLAARIPTPMECAQYPDQDSACQQLRGFLERLGDVAAAETHGAATVRCETVRLQLEEFLAPPPEDAEGDGSGELGGEDASTPAGSG